MLNMSRQEVLQYIKDKEAIYGRNYWGCVSSGPVTDAQLDCIIATADDETLDWVCGDILRAGVPGGFAGAVEHRIDLGTTADGKCSWAIYNVDAFGVASFVAAGVAEDVSGAFLAMEQFIPGIT